MTESVYFYGHLELPPGDVYFVVVRVGAFQARRDRVFQHPLRAEQVV
jgi:hypothetical protein